MAVARAGAGLGVKTSKKGTGGGRKVATTQRRTERKSDGRPSRTARRTTFPCVIASLRHSTCYCTAFTMSKIGRYIATTMPPTITPRTTIMIGSMRESSAPTATSTSES